MGVSLIPFTDLQTTEPAYHEVHIITGVVGPCTMHAHFFKPLSIHLHVIFCAETEFWNEQVIWAQYTPLNKQSEQQNACGTLPPEQHTQDQEYDGSVK